MKKATHGFKSKLFKLVALTLTLVLALGVLPVSAATTKKIVVTTKKQLIKALGKKSSATIVFKTNKKTTFVIPEVENSTNKKLVMKTPNAKVYNKAQFKTISLKSSGYFNERGKDNSIYVKSDGAQLTVSKGIEAKKISVTANDVLIKVASKAEVGDLVCNKKDASITVNVAKNAEANITIKKKTELTVTGNKTAEIKVVAQAKNSTVTASVPVEVVAEKNIDVVLEKGSEGSSVESAKGVDVDLSGEAKKEATVTEDGKTVQEPETKKEETKKEETKKDETKKDEAKKDDGTTASDNSGSSQGGYTPSPSVNEGIYKITYTVEDEGNGTVKVSDTASGKSVLPGTKVASGVALTVEIAPLSGRKVASVTVLPKNAEVNGSDNLWRLTNIKGDLVITVEFEVINGISGPKNVLRAAAVNATTVTVSGGAIVSTGGAVAAKKFILKDTQDVEWATVYVASGGAVSIDVDYHGHSQEHLATYDGIDFGGIGDNNGDIITEAVIRRIVEKFKNATHIYLPHWYSGNLSKDFTFEKKSNSVSVN